MGKRTEPLPKLEDYKAPWEVDSDGKPIPEEEQKIDTARLKKYLYNLLGDRQKAESDFAAEKQRADDLEQKVANAPSPEKLTELQTEVTKAREERDAATAKAEKDGQAGLQALKLEVALEKGLTLVQAKRLLGTTKEELEQDAEELLASFGNTGKTGDDDVDVRRGPRRVLTNAGDPDPSADKDKDEEIDPDKWAASAYAAKRGRGIR